MATGDFQSFLGSVKAHGLARLNRYNVVFSPPAGLLQQIGVSANTVDVFCNSLSMPGVTYSTVPDKVYGDTIEMPMSKSYGELRMELFVDQNMRIRYMFEQWMNRIEDPVTRNFGWYENYAAPIVIQILGYDESVAYTMNIQEAYPVTMSPVELSQSAATTPYYLTVEFKFRRFTIVPNALLSKGISQ